MLAASGNDARRSHLLAPTTEHGVSAPPSSTTHISNKEKPIWVIRGKETKAKEKNRKRPSLLQRKNEN
jgi:hypothetical protein